MQMMSSRSVPTFLNLCGVCGPDDDDVAWPCVDVLAVRRHARFPAANDPRLRVRMPVQVRSLTRLVVHEEHRDVGAVRLAFERHRAPRAPLLLIGANQAVHRSSSRRAYSAATRFGTTNAHASTTSSRSSGRVHRRHADDRPVVTEVGLVRQPELVGLLLDERVAPPLREREAELRLVTQNAR